MSQSNSGGRSYETRRPSSDQVRDFLNMRGNDSARLADNDRTRASVGRGDSDGQRALRGVDQNRIGGDQFRKPGEGPGIGGINDPKGGRDSGDRGDRTTDPSGRGPGSFGRGDGDRGGRDGKPDSDRDGGRGPGAGQIGDNGRGDRGDRDGGRGPGAGQLGDNGRGDRGDRDGRGPNGNGNDRDGRGSNWNGRDGDRDFRGGDDARRDYQRWSNSWKGKNGDGRDHRDWSGRWRDGDRFDIARNIRGQWWNRRDYNNFPFRSGWWGNNSFRRGGWGFWDDYAFRYNRPWYWWSWASAPILTSWCNFGWSTPYYWDYGPNEYIYCNNGVVYVNGSWYQPAPVFYAQTVQMIDKAPALPADAAAQVEWLPLGVFAVTPDGVAEADVLAQLAVTKDGLIGGTIFDQKAGKSYAATGTIDKNSQRAVWSYTNDQNVRIVMETSVNNLTQNESTGLVHYGPNDQRVIEIVRLQEPPADQPAAALPAP